MTELKRRVIQRKAELGVHYLQESVVSVLAEAPLEGFEPEAISEAIGLPAYMDPKKSVPGHAIVHGVLVKLLSEGLVTRAGGLRWVLIDTQA